MNRLIKTILIVTFLGLSRTASAAFPLDFSDVIWIGPNISGWPETSELDITGINGSTINMPHSKRNTWPISCRFAASERVNASAWGFVQVGGQWYAGTWEYLRAGSTTRSTATYGGPGHFRSPIGVFTPQNGQLYGFMVAGVSRDSLSCNNAAERSNVVMWRWGEGKVPLSEFEPGTVTHHIYEDTNRNGIEDTDEPGLQGVDVLITDSAGATQTVTTDANGDIPPTSVPAGNTVLDIIESTLPEGYELTEGTDPTTLVASNGVSVGDIDGYAPPQVSITPVISILLDEED